MCRLGAQRAGACPLHACASTGLRITTVDLACRYELHALSSDFYSPRFLVTGLYYCRYYRHNYSCGLAALNADATV